MIGAAAVNQIEWSDVTSFQDDEKVLRFINSKEAERLAEWAPPAPTTFPDKDQTSLHQALVPRAGWTRPTPLSRALSRNSRPR